MAHTPDMLSKRISKKYKVYWSNYSSLIIHTTARKGTERKSKHWPLLSEGLRDQLSFEMLILSNQMYFHFTV